MKNLTRVLALVLTFAMMISTVAFAATFTDIEAGSTYAEATAVLADLGILYGYEDGTFGADKVITRAEAVAVVNRLQGLSDAAKAAGGATQYTDVPSTEWYAGDVNLATQMGIITGDGNGLFRPNDQVKYEEAVKMVVAALGYTNDYVLQRGGWPTGYLVIATEAEISKGVAAGAGEPAYRGIVAKLAYNALTAPRFTLQSYETTMGAVRYAPDAKNITLEGNLNISKLTGYISANSVTNLINPTQTTENDKVNFIINNVKVGKEVEGWYTKEDGIAKGAITFISTKTDVADTLGYTVDIYVKENADGDYEIISYVLNSAKNKTVAIEDPSKIQASGLGTFDSNIDGLGEDFISVYDSEVDTTNTKYNLTVAESVYAEHAKLIVNGEYLGSVAANATKDMHNISGSPISDLGKIYAPKYGKVTLLDNNNDTYYDVVFVESYVVARVEDVINTESTKRIFTDDGMIDLLKHAKGEKGFTYSIEKDGEKADIDAIEKGDILAVAVDTNKKKFDIKATTEKVTGTVTERICDDVYANAADWEFVIDGEAYKIANLATPANSKLDKATLGSDVTFYLDAFGKVAYTEVTSTAAKNYGFIVNAGMNDTGMDKAYTVKMLDKEGKIETYELAEKATLYVGDTAVSGVDTNAEVLDEIVKLIPGAKNTSGTVTFTTTSGITTGDYANGLFTIKKADHPARYSEALANYANRIVTFKVNSSGKISNISYAASYTTGDESYLTIKGSAVENKEFSAKSSTIEKLFISDNTVVFNLPIQKDVTVEDFKVENSSTFVDEEEYDIAFFSVDKDAVVGAALITSDNATISKASNLAVITKVVAAHNSEGDEVFNISFIQAGENKTIATTSNLHDDLTPSFMTDAHGKVFEYALDSEGAIKAIALDGGAAADVATVDNYTLTPADEDLGYVFGIVYAKSNKVITLADPANLATQEHHVVADDANFYMVDLTRRDKDAKSFVSASSYAEILAYRPEAPNSSVVHADYDYAVFMKYSNEEIIDVVIYKGYALRNPAND